MLNYSLVDQKVAIEKIMKLGEDDFADAKRDANWLIIEEWMKNNFNYFAELALAHQTLFALLPGAK